MLVGYSLISALTILSGIVSAAPHEKMASSNLQTRGGTHSATVFSSDSCTGNTLGSVTNFGCGGVCYTADGAAIQSVLLNQADTTGPQPTADFFSDGACSNQIAHAGIFDNQNSGCTNFPYQAFSYYLYFDC